MENHKDAKNLILDTLIEKRTVKKLAFDNTTNTFNSIKQVLQTMTKEYNEALIVRNEGALLEFRDRGEHEIELRIADDMVVFNMQSNVFDFDKSHAVWKTAYVQKDPTASFCGVINVYNFLADSYRFNRVNDVGYLIARIFINKDSHYFLEGKRQLGFLYTDFENAVITDADLRKILESTLLFTLDFDLLVPDYDNVNMISVGQMKESMNTIKLQTDKRLGFKFSADKIGQ